MGGFANNAPIVTDGLVFYVDAGNGNSYPGSGGTWSDLVGGNDGSFNNMDDVNNPSNNYDSANGGSLVFDGTNDYVALSEGGLSFPNDNADFTCEVVLSLDDITSDQVFFQQENGSGTGRSWIFYRSSANPPVFSSYLGGSENELNSLNNPSTNTIYHLHVKYESGTLHIGYNGVWYQSYTKSIDENANGGFRIGSGKSTSAPIDGNIYCVRVYNKALTSDEILQNYNALKNRFV
jgi:hypothetical protein